MASGEENRADCQNYLIHHKKQNLKKANQFHKSDAHLVSKDNVLHKGINGVQKREMERTTTSNEEELKNISHGSIDGVKNLMRRRVYDDDGPGIPKSKAGDTVFGPSLGDASWDEELEIPDSVERIWRGTEFNFQKPTDIAPKPSTSSILKAGKDDGKTELNVWGPTEFVPGLLKTKSGSRSDYLKFGEHDIDSSDQFRKGQGDSHPVIRGGNHVNDHWKPPWDSNDAKSYQMSGALNSKVVWDPYAQTPNSDQPSWIPRGSQNTENSGKLPKEQSTFGKSPWSPERLLNSSRVSGVASGLLNFRTLEDPAGPPNFSSPRAPGAPPSFGPLRGAGEPPNFGTLRGPGGPSNFGTLRGLSGLPNFGSPRAPVGLPNFGPLRGAGGPQNFGTIRGPSEPPNFGGPGGPPNFAPPRGPGGPPNFGLSDWPGGSPDFKLPRGPAGPPNFETYRGPGGPPNFRLPTGLDGLQNFDIQGVSGRPPNFGLLSGSAGPPNFGRLGVSDGPNYGSPMGSGNFGALPNLGARQRTPWSQGGLTNLAGPSGSPNGYPGMGRGPNGPWGSGKGLGYSPGPSQDVHFSGKGNLYGTMQNLMKTWPSKPSQLWPGRQANLRQISDNKNKTPKVLTNPYETADADTPHTLNPLTDLTTEETRQLHNSNTPELSRNPHESSLVETPQTPNPPMEFKTAETPKLYSPISSTVEEATESHSLPAIIRETSQPPNINSSSSNLTTNDEENRNTKSIPSTNANDQTSAPTTKSVLPGFSNENKEQSQEILQIITTETTESTTTTEKGGKVKTGYPGGPQIIPDIADDEPDTHKYFTEFITQLCYRLSTMNRDDAKKIYFQIEKVVIRNVISSEMFAIAGQDILDSLQTLVAALNVNPPDYVQKLFSMGHYSLINRDLALSQDINSLLDFANALYTDEEKRSLATLLEEYNIYPNITSSTNDLLTRTINTLVISPFIRLKDTEDMAVLVESLNRVVSERATHKNKFNLPSYRRQESLPTRSSKAVKNVNRYKKNGGIFEYKFSKSDKMRAGKIFRSNKISELNVDGKYVDRNQIENVRRYKKNEKMTDNADGYINPSSITTGNARYANLNQIRESNKTDRSNVKINTFDIDSKYIYANIMKDRVKDANLKLKEKTTKEDNTKEGNSESSTESELYSTETEEFEKSSDTNFKVPYQNESSKNVPLNRKMKLLEVTARSSVIPTPESHGNQYRTHRSAENRIKLRNDQENKDKPLNTGSSRNKKDLREVLRKVVKGYRNRNLQSRKTKKLQNMASSYSDEEETLKFKVNQDLIKKDRRFSDGKDRFPDDVNDDEDKNRNPNYSSDLTMEVESGKIKKQPLNQMSSYSGENEEDTLKINLYEAFNKA